MSNESAIPDVVKVGHTPRHVRVNRRSIVDATLASIAEKGLTSITMREVGQALNVEAMTLYRYVAGKEDLLDAVADRIVEAVRLDQDVLKTSQGWRDFLRRLAYGLRRAALLNPRAFSLVASRPRDPSWLRPPLRTLDWVETFLTGLVEQGFSDESAAYAYRAFTSFLLGHLLLEVSSPSIDSSRAVASPQRLTELDEVPSERLKRLAPGSQEATAEFNEALESLFDQIARYGRP